jgi:hypothetical protein
MRRDRHAFDDIVPLHEDPHDGDWALLMLIEGGVVNAEDVGARIRSHARPMAGASATECFRYEQLDGIWRHGQ